MHTLNLANPKKSDIAFLISKYPDGQQDLRLLNFLQSNETTLSFGDLNGSDIIIKSRFNSIADFNLIKCAVACLRRLKVGKINLYVPYLLSARADRKFVDGGCCYLVDVIAPDIKSMGFDSVNVFDVHSDVSPACIPNLENTSVLPALTKLALLEINSNNSVHCHVISPDSGASKRTFATCKEISGWSFDIVECAKHRDMVTGEILETIVPVPDLNGEDCIIMDDICSKGGTFIGRNGVGGIVRKLKEKNAGDVYLVVTHFEGTADLQAMKDAGIKRVFTTNSIGNFETPDGFIKQLNVF